MRIGAFFFDSSVALLTERLNFPEELKKEESSEKMLQSHGCCFLDNIKPGIWIAGTPKIFLTEELSLKSIKLAYDISIRLNNISFVYISDLQLVRCPVCDLNTCDGNFNISNESCSYLNHLK
jgi:hypothetical protein